MNCLFCKIINGDISSKTIYENEYVKCFLDVNPKSKAHTLIVPKKHFKDVNDIENEYILKIHEASKIIIDIINKTYNPDGIMLVENNGSIQEIKHYHLHIIPHYNESDNKSLDEVYNELKKNC